MKALPCVCVLKGARSASGRRGSSSPANWEGSQDPRPPPSPARRVDRWDSQSFPGSHRRSAPLPRTERVSRRLPSVPGAPQSPTTAARRREREGAWRHSSPGTTLSRRRMAGAHRRRLSERRLAGSEAKRLLTLLRTPQSSTGGPDSVSGSSSEPEEFQLWLSDMEASPWAAASATQQGNPETTAAALPARLTPLLGVPSSPLPEPPSQPLLPSPFWPPPGPQPPNVSLPQRPLTAPTIYSGRERARVSAVRSLPFSSLSATLLPRPPSYSRTSSCATICQPLLTLPTHSE